MILDIPQGSPEWQQARCGSLGASMISDALAKTKSGWGAMRANLQTRLLIERITGVPQDSYQSQAMIDGIDREPDARAAYCFLAGAEVQTVGLIRHPEIDGSHASPDGLIGDNGVLEIKCPQPSAHLAALLGEPIPQKYLYQMLWQMRCADREWADYVSYSPQFPVEMQLVWKRVPRDDKMIASIESEVRIFLSELDEKVSQLRSRYGGETFVSPIKAQLEASLA